MSKLKSSVLVLGLLSLLQAPPARAKPKTTSETSLDVLAWNVFLRPTTLFRDRQAFRAARIPDRIKRYEVVVLSETFDDSMRARIVSGLRPTHPYLSRTLGRDVGVKQDGGVLVMSRWPIVAQDQLLYGPVCADADCLADKGVVYARIVKDGHPFHLFATHMQAGGNAKERAVRRKQLFLLRQFILSKRISPSEPVLIAGDLNVDRYGKEFGQMLGILDASFPTQYVGPRFTSDPNNPLVGKSHRGKFLDYVLYSNAHRRPTRSALETRIFRAPEPRKDIGDPGPGFLNLDLSDHYAVLGLMVFGNESP